jgi:hypothetical protein
MTNSKIRKILNIAYINEIENRKTIVKTIKL